jgi:hypothetical protein
MRKKTAVAMAQVEALAVKGCVCSALREGSSPATTYPKDQEEFTLDFLGLGRLQRSTEGQHRRVFSSSTRCGHRT